MRSDDEMVDQEQPKTKYDQCEIAKPDLVSFYEGCFPIDQSKKYVNIEGPEFSLDFSYFMVNMCPEILSLEVGIPISDNFDQKIKKRDIEMEFRVIERISLHHDHAKNLVVLNLSQFKDQNRH